MPTQQEDKTPKSRYGVRITTRSIEDTPIEDTPTTPAAFMGPLPPTPEAKDQIDPTTNIPADVSPTAFVGPLPPISEAQEGPEAGRRRREQEQMLMELEIGREHQDLRAGVGTSKTPTEPLGFWDRAWFGIAPTEDLRRRSFDKVFGEGNVTTTQELLEEVGSENFHMDPDLGLIYRRSEEHAWEAADEEGLTLGDFADIMGDIPEFAAQFAGIGAGIATTPVLGPGSYAAAGILSGGAVGATRLARLYVAELAGLADSKNPIGEATMAGLVAGISEVLGIKVAQAGGRVLAAMEFTKSGPAIRRYLDDLLAPWFPPAKVTRGFHKKVRPGTQELLDMYSWAQRDLPRLKNDFIDKIVMKRIISFPDDSRFVKKGIKYMQPLPHVVRDGVDAVTNAAELAVFGAGKMEKNRIFQKEYMNLFFAEIADRYAQGLPKAAIGKNLVDSLNRNSAMAKAGAIKLDNRLFKFAEQRKLNVDPTIINKFVNSKKMFGVAKHAYGDDLIKAMGALDLPKGLYKLYNSIDAESLRIATQAVESAVAKVGPGKLTPAMKKDLPQRIARAIVGPRGAPHVQAVEETLGKEIRGEYDKLIDIQFHRQSSPRDPEVLIESIRLMAGRESIPFKEAVEQRSRIMRLQRDLINSNQSSLPRGHVLYVLKKLYDKTIVQALKKDAPDLHALWTERQARWGEAYGRYGNAFVKSVLKRADPMYSKITRKVDGRTVQEGARQVAEYKAIVNTAFFEGPQQWQAIRHAASPEVWEKMQNFLITEILDKSKNAKDEIVPAKLLKFFSGSNPPIALSEFKDIMRDRGDIVFRLKTLAKLLHSQEQETIQGMFKVFIQLKQANIIADSARGQFRPFNAIFFGAPWFGAHLITSKTGFNLLTRAMRPGQGANELTANIIRLGAFKLGVEKFNQNFYDIEEDERTKGQRQLDTQQSPPLPGVVPLVHPQYQ
jgi:hypothetical protein